MGSNSSYLNTKKKIWKQVVFLRVAIWETNNENALRKKKSYFQKSHAD